MVPLRFKPTIAGLLLAASGAIAETPGVLVSAHAAHDAAPDPDPASAFWRDVAGVFADGDSRGRPVAGHRTEIRSRWTAQYLYLLFVCPYEQLYLKPNPDTRGETNRLWEWDVAEAFLGSDFNHIRRYKEFEVSPRGEWVDLDIDREKPRPVHDWSWNSGFQVAARIDAARHVWYAGMKIPWKALDTRPPSPGRELRANFYRAQGPPPERRMIEWRPTHRETFHTPESFGILRLAAPGAHFRNSAKSVRKQATASSIRASGAPSP